MRQQRGNNMDNIVNFQEYKNNKNIKLFCQSIGQVSNVGANVHDHAIGESLETMSRFLHDAGILDDTYDEDEDDDHAAWFPNDSPNS